MRQRLRSMRDRPMAMRPSDHGRINLSPRARRIAGWLVAALLILGIAVVVRVLGGNGDGTGAAPGGSGSPEASSAAVVFGTAIDDVTGEVAEDARVERFTAGDTFAYSASTSGIPPSTVYVEVERTGGGEAGVVQATADGAQQLPNPDVIAFTVPADNLLEVFGPGSYVLRIYADPVGEPIATGSFELVSVPGGSPSPST